MSFFQRHAYGFGCGFAALLWPFFPGRRRISVDNILRAGVTSAPKEARRIARRAFCHFVGHMTEALCAPSVVTAENWREHIDSEGASPELVRTLLERPDTPILIVSGHHGCWEAATNILSFARPMIAIARQLDSKLLRDWLEKRHFRGRVTVIAKNDGMSEGVMRKWVDEKAAMTVLMDQHASRGARLRFFGRPARTVTSAARMGIRTGYPVAVGSFVRIGPYRYRIVGGDPVVFDRATDRDAAAQILNDRLEAAIRQYPEQYLWMHRRWRED